MSEKTEKEVYRVTLDFSKKSQSFIEELQERAQISTKAELFKQALNIFDFVSEELGNGGKFVIIDSKGVSREIVFPMLRNRGNGKR